MMEESLRCLPDFRNYLLPFPLRGEGEGERGGGEKGKTLEFKLGQLYKRIELLAVTRT